ncbi:MAG: bifunctional 4-hydroxy-2-oxoglutarate aldolase/2-dehydro-3-deoxy-phosphogluconate aldolase [Clostridiales bacterium]|nr:bifunctional 4-hydroxy-2-oxoglutarate aldolase/2-dehydro-3-deoxy-phosphogluconate aldolase [Clostridiales bacterium]
MDFFDKAERAGIIPVVVIDDAADAVDTARALLAGGVSFMEITLRTACAPDAIRLVKENVPEMTVGAGTVLSLKAARTAIDAGATFIVSPGFVPEVADYCVTTSIPYIPGCVTPTEIIAAVSKGFDVVKFFPASVYGGIKAIKELASVFRSIKFLPTGGVNADNLEDYIREPYIAAVGGSWVCPAKLIASNNFEEITLRAKDAVDKIRAVREG